jgi:TonB family protein
MESPEQKLLRLLVEKDPASPGFRNEVRAALRAGSRRSPNSAGGDVPGNGGGSGHQNDHHGEGLNHNSDGFDLWHDVFVHRPLPWGRFVQSAILHGLAVGLIWTISFAWLRQQRMLANTFDRSSLVVYSPQEYLQPLDTGVIDPPKVEKADPVYAKQPIISVPREADNRTQTIVVPPDVKLEHDVAVPNIVATGAIVPEVPLDAAQASANRVVAPLAQVVAPAPDVAMARDRVVQAAMKTDVIAPPPELTQAKGRVGPVNIAPSQVVGPAPQLTLAEQHSLAGRRALTGGSVQPVAPPPSVTAAGSGNAGGRLIALGIHPVAPMGPVAVPSGNRRGTFSATPRGKAGATGTPDLTGAKASGSFSGRYGSLPSGLHVGGADEGNEMASIAAAGGPKNARAATPVPDDKITDVDRQVFGGKRPYSMTLNMPNLSSSTGSWVIRFAEMQAGAKKGELLAPVAMEKSDPGYPLELMRTNVHGMVTLYAVIQADGKVGEIRVINSPDDRLDAYAARALARWKFLPAERAGKPVALDAVVEIPFRVRGSF